MGEKRKKRKKRRDESTRELIQEKSSISHKNCEEMEPLGRHTLSALATS
jgi:hypothetical protein